MYNSIGYVIMYWNKEGDDYCIDRKIYDKEEAYKKVQELNLKASEDEKYWMTEVFINR